MTATVPLQLTFSQTIINRRKLSPFSSLAIYIVHSKLLFLFSFLLPGNTHSKVRSRNVGGLQSISLSIAPHEALARATPHIASSDSHSRALLILPRAVFCLPSVVKMYILFEYINSFNPDRRTRVKLVNFLLFSHPCSGRQPTWRRYLCTASVLLSLK